MSLIQIRKRSLSIETTYHEGGPVADTPLKLAAACAVIRNPYAGRYEPDLLPFMAELRALGARSVPIVSSGDTYTLCQSIQDVASFVAGITLASGLLFVLLAVFRMGWIAQFLSRAVVTGFLFGAAIDVVIGELRRTMATCGFESVKELQSAELVVIP